MKKLKGFRLSDNVLQTIEQISKNKSITQTDIIERAVKCLKENLSNNDKKLLLLKEQNKQIQIALNILKIALESKENELNAFKMLIEEKDQRIMELQERLKEKSKPFWKFWQT